MAASLFKHYILFSTIHPFFFSMIPLCLKVVKDSIFLLVCNLPREKTNWV